jgi:hypothetical protein
VTPKAGSGVVRFVDGDTIHVEVGGTPREGSRRARPLLLVTLTGRAGTIAQTTQRTDAQRELLAATGVQPLARITALQPA